MANASEGKTEKQCAKLHSSEESLLRSGNDKHGDNSRLQSELEMDQDVAESNEDIRSENKTKRGIIKGYG